MTIGCPEPGGAVECRFDGTTASVPVLDRSALSAIATYSDQTTEDVTRASSWASSDEDLVSIEAPGIVRGHIVAGRLVVPTVTASFQGRSAMVDVMLTENWQEVTVTLTTLTITGSCDHDSIFETSGDGEFEFTVTAFDETIWHQPRTSYDEGSYPIRSRSGTFVRQAASLRGKVNHVVSFRGTEYDGLLGADRDFRNKESVEALGYAGDGLWSGDKSNWISGKASPELCGAQVDYTVTSEPAPAP